MNTPLPIQPSHNRLFILGFFSILLLVLLSASINLYLLSRINDQVNQIVTINSRKTEALGVILLFPGLGTRIITLPLMVVMFVTIKTVHWQHEFAAGDNGFEIPLYYMLHAFYTIDSRSG